jgi:hypothetical protein
MVWHIKTRARLRMTFETGDAMKPLLTGAVTKRRLWITALSRIVRVLSVACMAALLVACGEESPEASSPTSPTSTSPTKTVAPSPKEVAPSPEKKSVDPSPIPTLRPGRCVSAPPSTSPTPTLDNDVCQVIVRYTRDWTVVKAKVDPTRLYQAGTRLHGWFDSPSTAEPVDARRWWAWEAIVPMGVPQSHQITVENAYPDVYGCGSQGMGRGVVPTVTVNREHGIITVVIPSPCISMQGVDMAPRSIRASVKLDTSGSSDDSGHGTAYFTDRLYPGDVAVQRR